MYKLTEDNFYIIKKIEDGITFIHPENEAYKDYLAWLAEGNEPEPPDYIPADVQLRNQRDMLLQQTDTPWGLADYQHPNKQAWLDYRQALRDLPETADPQLDENGQLTNVIWPLSPEEQ